MVEEPPGPPSSRSLVGGQSLRSRKGEIAVGAPRRCLGKVPDCVYETDVPARRPRKHEGAGYRPADEHAPPMLRYAVVCSVERVENDRVSAAAHIDALERSEEPIDDYAAVIAQKARYVLNDKRPRLQLRDHPCHLEQQVARRVRRLARSAEREALAGRT